jgi:putative hydrolase of the HAD superfamily
MKHPFPHKIIYEEFKKREGTYKIIKESKRIIEELSERYIKIGMVSNTSETSAEIRRPMLEEHGILNYFETLIFSSEVHYSKPDPKIFVLALEELQIPSKNVLHVGDSLYHDVNGAENVGLIPVLFDPLRFFSYDGYKIENLLELLKIVDKKA